MSLILYYQMKLCGGVWQEKGTYRAGSGCAPGGVAQPCAEDRGRRAERSAARTAVRLHSAHKARYCRTRVFKYPLKTRKPDTHIQYAP